MLDYFKIGHYTNTEKGTGVTVILAEKGAVAGVSVRGSSPATRETDLLSPLKRVDKINAVTLSGGSALGLEAASGVARYLYDNGFGYNAGKYKVPIVTGASIYDLEYKKFAFPTLENGYEAAKNAVCGNFERGMIGGSAGATVGKMLGMEYAEKTGLGVQLFSMNGLEIAVITVVNALGDIVDNDRILAGMQQNGEYLDSRKLMSLGSLELKQQNTTIGCILTNARLTKAEANILADLAHDGFATAISPSHTLFDGDAMFVMSSNERELEFNILSALIPTLTAQSIRSSVTSVEPINGKVNPLLLKLIQGIWKKTK